MSARAKLGVWLAVGFGGLAPFIFLLSALDINPKDPALGGGAYEARYAAEGVFRDPGSDPGSEPGLAFDTNQEEGEGRVLHIRGAGSELTTHLNTDGTVADGVYPLLWVFLPNPITNFGFYEWERKVRDDMGLIGEPGRVYDVRSTGHFIWWNYVISSQASYKAGIFDGGERVASAVYDMTCGMLFELVTHRGGYGRLELTSTSFPISRNRYWNALWLVLFSMAVIGVWRRRWVRAPEEKRTVALDQYHYAIAIALALAIDCVYDIWYFQWLGDWFTYALHLFAFAVFWKYFRWWSVGLLIEFGWTFSFMRAGATAAIPGFTYFPAMLITLAIMLAARPWPMKNRP